MENLFRSGLCHPQTGGEERPNRECRVLCFVAKSVFLRKAEERRKPKDRSRSALWCLCSVSVLSGRPNPRVFVLASFPQAGKIKRGHVYRVLSVVSRHLYIECESRLFCGRPALSSVVCGGAQRVAKTATRYAEKRNRDSVRGVDFCARNTNGLVALCIHRKQVHGDASDNKAGSSTARYICARHWQVYTSVYFKKLSGPATHLA